MLPGGYLDHAGVLHREFELSMLTGREEEMIAQTRRQETASLVTAVLARGVKRLGDISPVTEDIARALLVADRHFLLLKLRQMMFGDVVRADLHCPWPDCGQRVSLQFSIDDVPIEPAATRSPLHSLTLSPEAGHIDGVPIEVGFRLPNGDDQENVSPLLARNEAQALSELLHRTVRYIGPFSPPDREQVRALSSLARAEIEAEMERLSPKVEMNMDAVCSECARSFPASFDPHRLFFGELRSDGDLLYRQVHYLAYHYHWSENDIMAMSRNKRHKYIELLADEIERMNNAE